MNGIFVNTKQMHKHNVIFNKTVTKIVTNLTKIVFPHLNPTSYLKSIANSLSYSFATFARNGVTAFQVIPMFWKVVCYLEKINLKVIVATADGTSTNTEFFKMHKLLDGNTGTDQKVSTHKRIDFFFRHSISD